MSDLLSFLPGMKQITASEWHGPCPLCGGDDRFIVHPYSGTSGRWSCRKCSPMFDDGISLMRQWKGVGYREACEMLGVAARETGPRRDYAQKTRRIDARETKTVEPVSLSLPDEKWRRRAAGFLAECQRDIERRPDALSAITGRRFIPPKYALACGIGFNSEERYELRTAWGLPPIEGKPLGGKIRLPRGIVIASIRRDGIASMTIRLPDDRAENAPKYWEVAGGADAAFIAWSREKDAPVFLVESALDAALIYSESGATVTGVALQGATKRPDVALDAFLSSARGLIASPDNDDAGRAAWQAWRQWYPQALAFPASGGFKDVGDAHKATTDGWPEPPEGAMMTRDWIRHALAYMRKRVGK